MLVTLTSGLVALGGAFFVAKKRWNEGGMCIEGDREIISFLACVEIIGPKTRLACTDANL